VSIKDLQKNFLANRRLSFIAGQFIICIMMGCIGLTFAFFGERMAPGWNGTYLAWFFLAISVETIISRNTSRSLAGRDKWIFVASEYIFIAVLIKILLYLMNGFGQILVDVQQWQTDLSTFFSPEFFLDLVLVFAARIYCGQMLSDFDALQSDAEDVYTENIGFMEKDRLSTHQRLMEMVLGAGLAAVFITTLTRVRLPDALGIPDAWQAPVFNVVLYFVLALILLSQSQFALLHGRWLWQRTPVSPGMSKNWIIYTLAFFVILGLLILLLPTHYSLQLLYALQIVFSLITKIVLFTMALIAYFFTWLFSLFFTSHNQAQPEPMTPPQFNQVQTVVPPTPIPWLETLRAVVFWVIFGAVLVYAIKTYLLRNSLLISSLGRNSIIAWLMAGLKSIWSWLLGVNRQVSATLAATFLKGRSILNASTDAETSEFANPHSLPPRQKVIFYYLTLVRRSSQRGLPRKLNQTPLQFEETLRNSLPEVENEIDALTGSFIEARYSKHEIDGEKVNLLQEFWKRVMTTLRNWQDRPK
jgi:hypothetical protein